MTTNTGILAQYRFSINIIGTGENPFGSIIADNAWSAVAEHDRASGCTEDGCHTFDRCDVCRARRAALVSDFDAAEQRARDARREFVAAVWAAPYGRQSDGAFIDECRADWEGGRSRYVHLPGKRNGWVVRVTDSRGQRDLDLRTEERATHEATVQSAARKAANAVYEGRLAQGAYVVTSGGAYETCEGQNGGRFRLVSWVTGDDSAWISAPGVARRAGVDLATLHLAAENAPFERLAVGGDTVGDAGETVHVGYSWITPARYVGASRYDALDEEAYAEAQSRGVAVWVHRCSRDGDSLGWRSRAEPRATEATNAAHEE